MKNNKILIEKLVKQISNSEDIQMIYEVESNLPFCRMFVNCVGEHYAAVPKTDGHSIPVSKEYYHLWSPVFDAIHIAKYRIYVKDLYRGV